MLWTAAVESTHVHPSQKNARTCSLCLVAHATRPGFTSRHIAPQFVTVGLLQEEQIVAKARLDFSEAGIRGPPVL